MSACTNAERQALRKAAQVESLRAMRRARDSAEGAGLVSVSTSRPQGEPLLLEKDQLRFSRLRKNLGVAAKLHDLARRRGGSSCMVTLTYAEADAWRAHHVAQYLHCVRKWLARLTGDKLAYVWVAEIQTQRLAKYGDAVLHYHIVFWLPRGVTMPKADKRGWWPHGMTKTERVKRSAVAYVMKYASKFDSKEGLPHGARIYGVGGLDAAARGVRRWCNWPAFVQARAAVTDRYAPQVGGGWVNRVTGEWFPSEWGLVLATKKHTAIVRLHDHGRPVADVAGPYCWNPHAVQ